MVDSAKKVIEKNIDGVLKESTGSVKEKDRVDSDEFVIVKCRMLVNLSRGDTLKDTGYRPLPTVLVSECV